jgi:hypothetical protein
VILQERMKLFKFWIVNMNVRTLRKGQQLQRDPDVETPKLIHG